MFRSLGYSILILNVRSNCVFLHLLRFRITKQSASQEAETIPMATLDYGCVGYCNG